MMDVIFEFDVFLSHNSQDKPAVARLARLLRDRYGIKSWLDEWNLVPGDPWQQALGEALDRCQTFAVFIGSSGVGSWENPEMQVALDKGFKDRKRRVIPVLLPGAPDNRDLKLPAFLPLLSWVDFRSGLDNEKALWRLYCGIKGIPPGDPDRDAEGSSNLFDTEAEPISSIPELPLHNLVGREELLRNLKQQLFREKRFVLYGLPGVGKTTLVTALAHDEEIKKHFKGKILWATLGQNADVSSVLAKWAVELGMPESEISHLQTLENKVTALKQILPKDRKLFVIDDVWDPETAGRLMDVRDSTSTFLVTTRLPHVAKHVSEAGPLMKEVEELDSEDGLALLKQIVSAEWVASKAREMRQLVEAVGGLPLAIEIIGKYLLHEALDRPKSSQQKALEKLQKAALRLKIEREGSQQDVPASLMGIIGASDEVLGEEARAALRALSVFLAKPHSFSEEAAQSVCGIDSGEVLITLLDFGLLDLDKTGERYLIHQTIRDYARERLTDHTVYQRLIMYFAKYTKQHQKDFENLDIERENMLAALQTAFERVQHGLLDREAQIAFVEGINAFSDYLLTRGLYNLAEVHLEQAMSVAQQLRQQVDTFEAGTRELAATTMHRGTLKHHRGDYVKGGEDLIKALTLVEELKKDIMSRGQATNFEAIYSLIKSITKRLHQLGKTAAKGRDYPRAEEYYEKAWNAAREIADYESLLRITPDRGQTVIKLKHFEQAEAIYQEALHIAEKSANETNVRSILSELSKLEDERGNKNLADQYKKQVAQLLGEASKQAAESQRPSEIMKLLFEVAAFWIDRGDYAQARNYALKGLDLLRYIIQGIESEGTPQDKQAIAEVQRDIIGLLQGVRTLDFGRDYVQDEQYELEALDLAQKVGDRETECEQFLRLGQLAAKHGDDRKAEKYLQEALRTAAEMSHHRLMSELHIELGHFHLKLQRSDLANKAFNEALEQARIISNVDLIASAWYGLAQVAFARENINDARYFGEQSVAAYQSIHHDSVESVKLWLARLSPENNMQKFPPQLSVSFPEGWLVKESFTVLAPNGKANVIVASEQIDPSITTAQEYSQMQGDLLHAQFQGYRELAFTESQVFGHRTGYLRRFEWQPPEREKPVTQIQLYYVENGRSYTATATASSENFREVEQQLYQVLSDLEIKE